MANYYQILGIHPLADSTQIRVAYKRMAMAYHPDHNPGNPQAEDLFKLVNEAYHTLADPLKKAHYDALYFPQYLRPEPRIQIPRLPVTRAKPHYKIDREYYRMQALSLLIFVVIAGFCFGLMNIINYFAESKRQRHYQENTKALKRAGSLFASGRFEDAIRKIDTLAKSGPLEYRVHYTLDSLVHVLRLEADARFNDKDFASAAELYLLVRKYDMPVSDEIMQKLSMSEYYLGNYAEAMEAMKYLHEQYPENLELVYSIGLMNLEKLELPQVALHYFTLGKTLVNRDLERTYGPSFEHVTMDKRTPDLFSEVLHGRARSNMVLLNFEEVIADCSSAIHLKPDAGESYKLRAMANAKVRKLDTICSDLAQAKKLGAKDVYELEREFCR